jgi:hypothetical protein
VKIGARMSEERNALRQGPNELPIPFPYGTVVPKVMRSDCFDSYLDEAGNSIFVGVGTPANNQPRYSGFPAYRTAVKIVETRLRVGGRRRNLSDRQNGPRSIVKSHQIASRCPSFGNQPTREIGNDVGIFSCWPASPGLLCTHARAGQKCRRQKQTDLHSPPAATNTPCVSFGISSLWRETINPDRGFRRARASFAYQFARALHINPPELRYQ